MNKLRNAVRVALVVTAISAGTTAMAVESASAHVGSWKRERNGCLYTGGVNSLDNMAYTKKQYGGCTGHALLQVQYTDGTTSPQLHAADSYEIYGPILHAWHRSQSGEGWGQSH